MVVAPVPGKPYFHYLFPTLSGNDFWVVADAIIDCSGGTPVITQNRQRIDGTATYSGGNPGLAATKQLTDGTQRLYVVAGSSASYCTLNSGGGLSSQILVTGTSSGAIDTSCEAELSPDGKWLAWGANQAYICDIVVVALAHLFRFTVRRITPLPF